MKRLSSVQISDPVTTHCHNSTHPLKLDSAAQAQCTAAARSASPEYGWKNMDGNVKDINND